MPLLSESTYRPPRFFSNSHVQTIFPSLFRKVSGVQYRRERIDTPDGDFLDVDFSVTGSSRVAVLLHGLEGDSHRHYMMGMAKALNRAGWDAAAMNFRCCSGECNRTLRFYHSGDTEDLRTVLSYIDSSHRYDEIGLVGFSLGGNVILKYLGESGEQSHPLVRKAAVFSVPCDLAACSLNMELPSNRIYLKRFLRMLGDKVRMKMRVMPDKIDDSALRNIKTFKEYDDRYTAPIHGFADAFDYWTKSSSRQFLSSISIPTLLVNAADDPFLPDECYPREEAANSAKLQLEIPSHGGHVGFVAFNDGGQYWSETRAVNFLST